MSRCPEVVRFSLGEFETKRQHKNHRDGTKRDQSEAILRPHFETALRNAKISRLQTLANRSTISLGGLSSGIARTSRKSPFLPNVRNLTKFDHREQCPDANSKVKICKTKNIHSGLSRRGSAHPEPPAVRVREGWGQVGGSARQRTHDSARPGKDRPTHTHTRTRSQDCMRLANETISPPKSTHTHTYTQRHDACEIQLRAAKL